MDAVKLLTDDHRRVEELIRQFQSLQERAARVKVIQEISRELHLHTQEEESIFYPAYREATKDQEMVQHSLKEHQAVKDLLASFTDEVQDDQLVAKVQKLKQLLADHIEEEEKTMFPKARQQLDEAELTRLGDRMQQAKAQFMEKMPRLKITLAPESRVEERKLR